MERHALSTANSVNRLWQVTMTAELLDPKMSLRNSSVQLHAPLGVRSVKCKHQSPEWTNLSHYDCFIQGEVIGFQVLLDSLYPRSTRASWWSPPVLQGAAVKIFLASVSSGIRKTLPNKEKRCAYW